MSRASWLGRPTGRHAAGGRGRPRAADPAPTDGTPADGTPADGTATEAARTETGRAGTWPVAPGPAAQAPPWGATPPRPAGPGREAPPWAAAATPGGAGLLGAPTMADATLAEPGTRGAPPLVSPVTDAARAAVASSAASLPAFVPPGAAPLITIDALGRKCPIPIILLAQQIRDVPVGSVIAVLADDPAAYTDIPAWCGLKSHDCVFRADYATGWSFGIRRRY